MDYLTIVKNVGEKIVKWAENKISLRQCLRWSRGDHRIRPDNKIDHSK